MRLTPPNVADALAPLSVPWEMEAVIDLSALTITRLLVNGWSKSRILADGKLKNSPNTHGVGRTKIERGSLLICTDGNFFCILWGHAIILADDRIIIRVNNE
jgi:hypothetical protein